MAWSEIRRALAEKWTDLKTVLKSYFAGEPAEARAQRRERVEVSNEIRATSRLIGNLLGSLTIPDEFAKHEFRPIHALMALNLPLAGDWYSLKGAKYCLNTYLDELTERDLLALSSGVLRREGYCDFMLRCISTRPDDASRMQVSRLLGDIAEAVNQRVLRYTVHEPLTRIVELLAVDPVNEQDLHTRLLMLTDDWITMKRYCESLSTDEFKALLGALQPQNLKTVPKALLKAHSFKELKSALDWEFNYRRAPLSLRVEQQNLDRAWRAGNRLAVSEALYRLSLAVEETCQVWEVLPDKTMKCVQQLVERSMDLFRDRQNNPEGPLNGHSLRKLDENIRANFGAAGPVLRSFGLELDPELRVC
ncbi:hypothetical protein [Alcaligenes sp. WGS1538]|uniref:hypothetical protein n=1 Tax=Alcaligenes sp. WGS1538 TaxID=3366811 RepID=UPI00372D34C5